MFLLEMILYLCICTYINGYRMRIMKTAILNIAPNIKEHHIVVVEEYNRILYAIDFTPIDQSDPKTLLNLFFAKNVPAEIRIKYITNTDFFDDNRIFDQWLSKPCIPSPFSCIEKWNATYMNLYTHNCQHFSCFMNGHNITPL
jgi:hypothetical protein